MKVEEFAAFAAIFTAVVFFTVEAEEMEKHIHAKHLDGELVDVKVEDLENEQVKVEFKSHGKMHRLILHESPQQLDRVPMFTASGTGLSQVDLQDRFKNVKLMRDRKYRATVAFRTDAKGKIEPVIQSGVFKLGKHEFNLVSHSYNKVKVVKRMAEDFPYHGSRKHMKPTAVREKRSTPISVTPINATVDLMVIADFSITDVFLQGPTFAASATSAIEDLMLYFAHLVDMMDVAYAGMKNDDIKINVVFAGILILENATALSNLTEDHKVLLNGKPALDDEQALTRLEDWVKTPQASILPPNDHVMLFTRLDLFIGSNNSTTTLGLANTGAICQLGKSSSIIEVLNIHSFVADTATHELGHSLGAVHDGDGIAKNCMDKNFIMAATAGQRPIFANRYLFTCCSQRSFYGIVRRVSCLSGSQAMPNYPASITTNVANNLPGEEFDLDDQCFIAFGTQACATQGNICDNVQCIDPADNSKCITEFSGAADGTPCSSTPPSWCSRGVCVPEGQTHDTADLNCNVSDCYGDELRCETGFNMFRLGYFKCYPPSAMCNGFSSCSCGTDEVGCKPFICPSNFTKCANGFATGERPAGGAPLACVKDEYICDNFTNDCSDNSDEVNCPVPCPSPDPAKTTQCGKEGMVDCANIKLPDCNSCEVIRKTCCNKCYNLRNSCTAEKCEEIKKENCKVTCKQYARECCKTCCDKYPATC